MYSLVPSIKLKIIYACNAMIFYAYVIFFPTESLYWGLALPLAMVLTWLAFGAPVTAEAKNRMSRRISEWKQPLCIRLICGVYALIFFSCSPVAIAFAMYMLYGGNPGGPSSYSSPPERHLLVGIIGCCICLLIPISALFFTWLSFGAPFAPELKSERD